MAKRSKKIETEIDDDDFEDSQSGGLSKDQLVKASQEYASLKSKMDDARSPMGSFFKDFEEKGGHKAAFKMAMKLADMETIKAQDFWRSFERYCDELGIFAQHDLLDDLSRPAREEAQKPAKAISTQESLAAH